MAKAIKLNNDIYLDSNNVNYKRKILKDIISNILSNPIGEFIIWEGNKEITSNGTWQQIATYYSLKETVIAKFPLKDKFTRKYKLCLEVTDNIGGVGNYEYIKFSQESYSKEYMYPNIWGSSEDGYRAFKMQDFDFDGLPNGTITIYATPAFLASGSTMRIYKLYLLIYDTIE